MSDALRRLPAFAGWTDEALTRLEQGLERRAVPAGHVFVREGDTEAERALFFLTRGRVEVSRATVDGAGTQRFMLDEGALFGVVAFVDHGPRAATVTAASEAEVLVLREDAFSRLAPDLAVRFELVIARQLASDFAAMTERAGGALASAQQAPRAGPRHVTLTSYSGVHTLRAELHEARSLREVLATLAAARRQGRRVVLRGAGLSFDTQAMAQEVALSLDGFRDVTVDREARTVTAGASARWGDVVAACAAEGLMPAVVVSGSDITVGGTVSMNGLSRFSPVFGKEGRWLESLEVLTAKGERVVCSRTKEPDLFFGIVAGFGQLALILRATARLLPLGTPIRVESRVEKAVSVERLAPALLVSEDDSPHARTAYAVVAFKDDEVRSIITRSRYVNEVPLRTLLPHRPVNVTRVPVELAIHHVQSMGQSFWNYAFERYLDEGATYVDELAGYTFFMDGNVRTRRASLAMGLSFSTVQQTYLVPAPQQLGPFILKARAMTRALGLGLALVDVLYLHEDEPFALTSTRGLGGYAVTFTFEGVDAAEVLGRIRELFVDLTDAVVALGGRVHLTKNVFVRQGALARMYREGVSQLVKAQRTFDPQGLFTSDFAQRLFPELSVR